MERLRPVGAAQYRRRGPSSRTLSGQQEHPLIGAAIPGTRFEFGLHLHANGTTQGCDALALQRVVGLDAFAQLGKNATAVENSQKLRRVGLGRRHLREKLRHRFLAVPTAQMIFSRIGVQSNEQSSAAAPKTSSLTLTNSIHESSRREQETERSRRRDPARRPIETGGPSALRLAGRTRPEDRKFKRSFVDLWRGQPGQPGQTRHLTRPVLPLKSTATR